MKSKKKTQKKQTKTQNVLNSCYKMVFCKVLTVEERVGVLETVFQVYVVPKNLTTEKFLDIIITHTAMCTFKLNRHCLTSEKIYRKKCISTRPP